MMDTGIRNDKILTLTTDDDGVRLDRFVQRNVPAAGFALVQKLVRKGALRVDGKRAKADTRLSVGQSVYLPQTLADLLPTEHDAGEEGSATQLTSAQRRWLALLKATRIEDRGDLLVLNKPAGLAVQGGSKTMTHIDGILSHFADDAGRVPKLVHRLDRDTSGLLLTARGRMASDLAQKFASREVKKIYLAWCWGRPTSRSGLQTAKLLKRRIKNDDHKERVVVDEEQGQFAQSEYHVLASGRISGGHGPRISLIQWLPLTGRTHQLRVHAMNLGNSIVGDPKYGSNLCLNISDRDQKILNQARLMLHARAISLPMEGKQKRFCAPIPEPMRAVGKLIGLLNFDEVEREFGAQI